MNSKQSLIVIAIPFTGGNAHSYKLLEQQLPKQYSWTTLELPGRGSRISENLLEDINIMIDDLFGQLKMIISKRQQYILFGHSLGAILGYELVKKLSSSNLCLPISLVVSGRGAPGTHCNLKRSELSHDDFWKTVYDLGGIPKEMLGQQELLKFYYPILKADFIAEENYEFQLPIQQISPPINVIISEDDMDENKSGESLLEDVEKWKFLSASNCSISILPGNHFFIFNYPEKVVDLILSSTSLEIK